MDSVIAYIMEPLCRFHNKNYDTSLVPDDITQYDLTPFWRCSVEEMYKRIFLFYESPYFHQTKPVQGAQLALKKISKTHELHLITSRPYEVEAVSHAWLTTYFPQVFAYVHHTNQVSRTKSEKSIKKSEVCKSVGATLMIDDHIDYAIDCAEGGISTLLFEAPWNKTYTPTHANIRRVANWNEVASLVK